jgi:hypothetical protein
LENDIAAMTTLWENNNFSPKFFDQSELEKRTTEDDGFWVFGARTGAFWLVLVWLKPNENAGENHAPIKYFTPKYITPRSRRPNQAI